MRPITISRTAAGISSWTADRDVLVQSYQTAGTVNALVSTNPTAAASDLSAPSSSQVRDDVIFIAGSGNIPAGVLRIPVAFPVAAGGVVYVQMSALGSVVLWVDDVISAE